MKAKVQRIQINHSLDSCNIKYYYCTRPNNSCMSFLICSFDLSSCLCAIFTGRARKISITWQDQRQGPRHQQLPTQQSCGEILEIRLGRKKILITFGKILTTLQVCAFNCTDQDATLIINTISYSPVLQMETPA